MTKKARKGFLLLLLLQQKHCIQQQQLQQQAPRCNMPTDYLLR
jgi:hypothetical protein